MLIIKFYFETLLQEMAHRELSRCFLRLGHVPVSLQLVTDSCRVFKKAVKIQLNMYVSMIFNALCSV